MGSAEVEQSGLEHTVMKNPWVGRSGVEHSGVEHSRGEHSDWIIIESFKLGL